MATQYFQVNYDNEASGPFVAEGALLTWDAAASSGFIVTVIDRGTTGKLVVALLTGSLPDDNDQLTQGSTTADADGAGRNILYPAYFREDVSVPASGQMAWTGPALGVTHSFFWDGQSANCTVGDILTFSGGQQCELITVEADNGGDGEYSVRWITPIDTLGYPADNDTFSNGVLGDGVLNGAVHERAYTPLHLHRLLADLNDDDDIAGDDDLSRVDATASSKSTDQIVDLLSNININDTIAQHMYGGSVSQNAAADLYSGLAVQVTSPLADTRPVLIQYDPATGTDAVITDYWKNAFMPDSIKGQIRLLRKTKSDGAVIDGQRIRGGLVEFNYSYFFGGTTLGTAETALALFTASDGNNQTAVGTVAGAPYNTVVQVEGYQTINYNNGNGATPYAYKIDYGSANALQTYERTKYIQRRGTSETLFGRNAQLFTGINLNFAYDNEAAGPFTEDEIICWGTIIPYTGESGGPFTVGEVITGGTSLSKGRIIYLDDQGTTGTIIVMDVTGSFNNTETITGESSGATATTGTVTNNTVGGRMLLAALNDLGSAGNLYGQLISGLIPADGQKVYGATSLANADVDGTPATRTVNNQYIGVFTGTNFQTNFGLGTDPSDAIVGDQLRNLLDVAQEPPNNQQGVVDGLEIGDVVTAYPWDGTSTDINGEAEPNYDEQALAVALTAGVSTVVNVGAGNIPDNTPQSGFLRIERDSDNNMDLVEYASHDGDDEYTLVGTAPSNASISNNVMRALIDAEVAAGSSLSYTAVKGATNTQVTIKVRNGSTLNGPIKPYPTTATFGNNGFSVTASRISDA